MNDTSFFKIEDNQNPMETRKFRPVNDDSYEKRRRKVVRQCGQLINDINDWHFFYYSTSIRFLLSVFVLISPTPPSSVSRVKNNRLVYDFTGRTDPRPTEGLRARDLRDNTVSRGPYGQRSKNRVLSRRTKQKILTWRLRMANDYCRRRYRRLPTAVSWKIKKITFKNILSSKSDPREITSRNGCPSRHADFVD